MGYIRALGEELRKLLTDLPKEKQEEVIKFVKEKVWDSYKNGMAQQKKRPRHK